MFKMFNTNSKLISVRHIGPYALISGLEYLVTTYPTFVELLVEMLESELYSPDAVSEHELSVNDKRELDTLYKEKKLILKGEFCAMYIDIIVANKVVCRLPQHKIYY
jgi:hypothetical protein